SNALSALSLHDARPICEYEVQDQRANIWYFGQGAGLDFNPLPDDPVAPIAGPVNSPAGVSVLSDRNGQVIFSTDGQHIYNKNDRSEEHTSELQSRENLV